eukprot:356155-Chlamydomonas_euryale.AAC.3
MRMRPPAPCGMGAWRRTHHGVVGARAALLRALCQQTECSRHRQSPGRLPQQRRAMLLAAPIPRATAAGTHPEYDARAADDHSGLPRRRPAVQEPAVGHPLPAFEPYEELVPALQPAVRQPLPASDPRNAPSQAGQSGRGTPLAVRPQDASPLTPRRCTTAAAADAGAQHAAPPVPPVPYRGSYRSPEHALLDAGFKPAVATLAGVELRGGYRTPRRARSGGVLCTWAPGSRALTHGGQQRLCLAHRPKKRAQAWVRPWVLQPLTRPWVLEPLTIPWVLSPLALNWVLLPLPSPLGAITACAKLSAATTTIPLGCYHRLR